MASSTSDFLGVHVLERLDEVQIPLREHADEPPSLEHGEVTDAVVVHHPVGFGERAFVPIVWTERVMKFSMASSWAFLGVHEQVANPWPTSPLG